MGPEKFVWPRAPKSVNPALLKKGFQKNLISTGLSEKGQLKLNNRIKS